MTLEETQHLTASSSAVGRLARKARQGGNYLAVFVTGVPLAVLSSDLYGGGAVFKGQSAAVLAPLAISLISVVFWTVYPWGGWFSKLAVAFLISMGVAWGAIWLLERADGQGVNYAAFLVPALVAMLLTKPVGPTFVRRAALALSWSMLVAVLIAELHAIATGYRMEGLNLALRIPGVSAAVTEGVRWQGPFQNPNYAGPIAAFMLVFALSTRFRWRPLMLGASAAMLLLAGSRSAFMGLFVGVTVLALFSHSPRLRRVPVRARLLWTALAGLVLMAAAVALDPSLNGRVPIWPKYWHLWLWSPLDGVGTTHIQEQIRMGNLDPWDVHAHNLVLDVMGRYGLVALVPVLIMLVLAVWSTYRAARNGAALGLALVSAFLTIGLVEVHGSWLYWGAPTVWLLLAVLGSGISCGPSVKSPPSNPVCGASDSHPGC